MRDISKYLSKRCVRRAFRFFWRHKWCQPLIVKYWPTVKIKIGSHIYLLGIWDNFGDRRMYVTGKANSPMSISRLTAFVAGKRSLIFDIGANIGSFTVPLAACTGHGSKIYAFEPIPKLANRVRENLQLNGLLSRVSIEEIALGNDVEETNFYLQDTNLGGSSLHRKPSRRTIRVPVKPLSDYLPNFEFDYEVFIIKIDVEGYEDQILVPFLSELTRDRRPDVILTEINHQELWQRDLLGFLHELDYKSFFVGEENNAFFLNHPKLEK